MLNKNHLQSRIYIHLKILSQKINFTQTEKKSGIHIHLKALS